MATTAVLRFSTEGRPSSKPDFLEWAHSNQIDETNEGTSQEEFERLYDEYYQDKADILSNRGHNTNVDKITRVNTIDNDRYRIEQIRHRWDRVQRVQDVIRYPFLVPAATKYPFGKFVQSPKLLELCASLVARFDLRDSLSYFDGDLAKFAANQYGLKFCKARTSLIVPFFFISRTERSDGKLNYKRDLIIGKLTSDPDETNTNISAAFADTEKLPDSKFKRSLEEVGEAAEGVADEIKDCDEDFIMVRINIVGCSYVPEDDPEEEDTIKTTYHANSLIINLATKSAVYFEPHMKSTDSTMIPYGGVQKCVTQYLKSIDSAFTVRDVPTACPEIGVGKVQGNDGLCASWSLYAGLAFMLNPGIPETSITDTISLFDIARMLYCAFYYTPLELSPSEMRKMRSRMQNRAIRRSYSLVEILHYYPRFFNRRQFYSRHWSKDAIEYLTKSDWTETLEKFSAPA